MKYTVNENCIGCGLCAETCPDVFQLTESGVAEANNDGLNASNEETAALAMENCPVEAIEMK